MEKTSLSDLKDHSALSTIDRNFFLRRIETVKSFKKSKSQSLSGRVKSKDYTLKADVKVELDHELKTTKGSKRFSDPEKAKAFLRTCVK